MTKSDSKYGDNGIARMSQKLDWDKDLKKKIISICGIPQFDWVVRSNLIGKHNHIEQWLHLLVNTCPFFIDEN